jgi:GST-like protein
MKRAKAAGEIALSSTALVARCSQIEGFYADRRSERVPICRIADLWSASKAILGSAATEKDMIDLYYWTTPNGHKITLFLEETGLPYKIHPVNIGKGEQFRPEFLAVAPNNRMPAIIDQAPKDGGAPISIFESGAILLYLAEKTGQFLSSDVRVRVQTLEWLFWQMAGLGPMAGQNHHFNRYAPEKIPYAIERYVKETNRLYGVLNKRLADRSFVAGDYSIADMASYPWIVAHKAQGQNLDDFPHLKRWFEEIKARPATVRAYAKATEINPSPPPVIDEEARKILFGQTAAHVK